MKIGIIGCGLNADKHICFAKDYAGAKIVGLVDKDKGKAVECAKRHKIRHIFPSIEMLVEKAKPDVIHIVTPPQSHCPLAQEAIKSGAHVLVEKPFTLNADEAKHLYILAEKHNVKLCTMHNHFFDPCMAKAHELIKSGKVGQIINVESYYGLNSYIDAFRAYPAPNEVPGLYKLPGGVFHDFMPHPLYVMLEYTGRPKELRVMESSHGVLPQNMSDELKILVNGENAFGTLTFSFSANPYLHFIRIYGTKMMLQVNIDTMTTIIHPVSSLPKAAQKATYNLTESWQLFTSTASNTFNFLTGKLKPYQGMKILIHNFYDAVKGKKDLPVTREQALMVMESMDEIWKQVKNKSLRFDPIIPKQKLNSKKDGPKILVTGASGFLGRRLVEMLDAKGYQIRVLVRKLSNIEKLKSLNVEIYFGDVAGIDSMEDAFKGIGIVVHAAAGTSGTLEDSQMATIQGTKNVLTLCEKNHIKKLVYISSCSVYGIVDYRNNQKVTEESSLERKPMKRGYYSYSKLEAEKIVTKKMGDNKFPIICLRPGTILGPGGDIFSPMIGFSFMNKIFMVISAKKLQLPFVYIDNLVDAIITSIKNNKANGNVYNVVDTQRINKKQYMGRLIKKLFPESYIFYLPYSFLYYTTLLQEILCKIVKKSPFLTRYRLISSQRPIVYDSSKIINELNWEPLVSIDKALKKIYEYEFNKKS